MSRLRLIIPCLVSLLAMVQAPAESIEVDGRIQLTNSNTVVWWALSSAAKILPDTAPPKHQTASVQLRCARNEREVVQVLVSPASALSNLTLEVTAFAGPSSSGIASTNIEILQARYVNVTMPTDRSAKPGLWPDPLVPVRSPITLEAGTNHAFWIRVYVPTDASAGVYRASLRMRALNWYAAVPLELTVYGFALPNQMSCQTAFGFSADEVFRYHNLQTEQSRREVLEKYWANLSAHHISPYDPAPLDPINVTWPKVRPPYSDLAQWQNRRLVSNEVHSGKGALLVLDDKMDTNVVVSYDAFIPIPAKGLRFKGWCRTAVPGHRFTIALNQYDADHKWMVGENRDISFEGTGHWQTIEHVFSDFPAAAKYVRLNLMGAVWTEPGEKIGLVWFDHLSLQNPETGEELLSGGDFEKLDRKDLAVPADQLRPVFDFEAWDKAMARAFDVYHFNSFSIPIPGIGGGDFYELAHPSLLGFEEDAPEYPILLGSYCNQLASHLKSKGWIDESYVYWFDEPSAEQYPFLQKGFAKLKQYCPEIPRMITKHVEPGLIGGPNLWCPISYEYKPEVAAERRKHGERFWWYVCTGPKEPYAGLFLDHSAPELRIWLWQTFQRDISGILLWQCNFWNSITAYPDPKDPQNPYEDPMGWTYGYGLPDGKRIPWGNGDGRFIYPPLAAASGNPPQPVLDGPVDSVRWEHLRDGIEDYEYLVMLRKKLQERGSGLAPDKLQTYQALLTVPENITRTMTEFAPNGTTLELRRHEIARAIEKLSSPINYER